MAVWIYAYGKYGLGMDCDIQSKQCLDILNNIPLDEVKILDSVIETKHNAFSVRKHYTDNRETLECNFKLMTADEYKAYLNSIKFPYIEIDNIIDYFIVEGENREQEKLSHFNFAYSEFKNGNVKSKWELAENGSLVNKICYFDSYNGLRLSFINDLIKITGPMSVFSKYFDFLQTISLKSREYYHSYFKNVFMALGSEFILYAHEWSGLDDEDNEEFDFEELKKTSNWEITGSDSIHNMDRLYYEQLTKH